MNRLPILSWRRTILRAAFYREVLNWMVMTG